MARLSAKLRSVAWEGGRGIAWWCPGCDECHLITTERVGPGPKWSFDGNVESPTVAPSIRISQKETRCHCFVRAGQIEFLSDCIHPLAGKTVPMPDWPWAEGEYGGV